MLIINKDGTYEGDLETPLPIKKKKENKTLKEIEFFKKKEKTYLTEAKQLSNYCDNRGKPRINQLKLSRLGIMYHLNNYDLTYSKYIGYKSIISGIITIIITLILLLTTKYFYIGLISFPIIYILIGNYYKGLNRKDNKDILSDISNIYTILTIDFSSGVYVNECFNHIKEIVKNKRLKFAFDELIQNINNRDISIDESILLFNNRFSSKELEKISKYIIDMIKLGINEELTTKLNKESGLIITNINKTYAIQTINHITLIANIFTFFVVCFIGYFIWKHFNLNIFILR